MLPALPIEIVVYGLDACMKIMDKKTFSKFKEQDSCVKTIAAKMKTLPEHVESGIEKLINDVALLEELS